MHPTASMMDGFQMVNSIDGGNAKFTHGPYKGRTYRDVIDDPDVGVKALLNSVLKNAQPMKLPKYQQAFRA